MNDSTIEQFSKDIKKEIPAWLNTSEGKNYPYSNEISELPKLFDILNSIRLSTHPYFSINNLEIFNKKITNTIEYTVSHLDFLPEALMGPKGYIDDLYMVCLCFNDLLSHPNFEIQKLGIDINFIDNVLTNAEDIFLNVHNDGQSILKQLQDTYDNY
tara:strand:+ start:298 stop:768 length:471 start_codon:yes stop_codon:yes gene_type:complete